MASSALMEGLSCPVCLEVFREPVVLSCSHSFCRDCVARSWRARGSKECPQCRRTCSEPLQNLTLRNLCDAYSLESRRGAAAPEPLCASHREPLRLFCLQDQQLACVVCQTSRKHALHRFCPVGEAAQDQRAELTSALKILKKKLGVFKQAKDIYDQELQHIKKQANHTEKMIKDEFKAFHQFLRNEEALRISALKREETRKSQVMQNRILDIKSKMEALTGDISALSNEMQIGDIPFLQNIKAVTKRSQRSLRDPQMVSEALIDVAQHLGNLKFKVWTKMQDIVEYTPVILDPNTASPRLKLSTNLTSLSCEDDQCQLPANPERFSSISCVIGSEGFFSGKHCWEVDVRGCADWLVGVTSTPEQTKAESVWKGILGIQSRKGKYKAWSSSESGPLFQQQTKLRRLRVKLQCKNAQARVEFLDSKSDTLLYKDICPFTERVYPFFWVTSMSTQLRILPVMCSLEMAY